MKGISTFAKLAGALLLLLTVLAYAGDTAAQTADSDVIAFDMVDSTSQNLLGFVNNAPSFGSPGDCFGKEQRPGGPFAVLDDSLVGFPGDEQGIIDESNTDEFFCIVDTENGDNSGPVSASWTFDVSGATNLALSLDVGAMGDFEAGGSTNDFFLIEAAIDGGPAATLFASTVDEAASQTYTLADGDMFTLNDPMLLDGVVLSNVLQTFTAPITGSGSALEITVTAQGNGGSEAVAFQNLIVAAGTVAPPPTGQPLPLTEGFDDCTLAGWEIISVDSDAANTWECNDFFSNIEANGFGDAAPADEWLITPPLDMDAQENDTLRFRSYTRFTDAGVPYPQVTVQYSTDYAGSGDPTGATWTALTGITFSPEDSRQWVDSGVIDLSGISGDTVYFAFRYQSSGTGGGSAALWRLDGINFASFIPVGQCGDPAPNLIHGIQGIGDDGADPLLGETVVVEGVVVGDFQANDGDHTDLSGFFIQEEDGDADGDPLTSEGIFVFAPGAGDVNVGDRLRIKGAAGDFFGMTQIESVADLVACGPTALPAVTELTLPVADTADLEAFEGMYVRFPQDLTVSEFFNFDRFGEIVLTTDRQFQPTATFDPGTSDAAALADLNARSRITLDDGRTSQNPDPAIHPNGAEFTLVNSFRGGDLVTNATGVLNYSFSRYRLQPTEGAAYTAVNDRPAVPDVGGNITVASFNVLNYFNTLDDGPDICGPNQDLECRGADNETERIRQLDKIVSAMTTMDADVIGIIEVENTTGVEAMADIVAGMNGIVGPNTYAYVDTGTIGTDAIKVGFIYNTTTVSLVGDYAVLDTPEFVNPNTPDPKNRPALAQTFMASDTGGIFTAVVNHLKSKGSPCGPGDDDPEAGSCNLTRALAAQALAEWLATDPTGSGDEDFLIIGDLNAYDKEDPIDVLRANGFSDLLLAYQGEFAYSYVFDGQLGYLDYGMANAGLADEVTGAGAWHINADEPDIIDYDTTFKQDAQDALYAPDPFRSSDHDPVLVGLDVCDEIAPTLSVTMTPDMLWPPNHQYVTISPIIEVSDNFDTDVTVTLLNVESNEPDNGLGDGDTPDDIVINGDGTVDVRAERSGTGDGRTYTFTYEAVDDCGNSTIATATVEVPRDRGRH